MYTPFCDTIYVLPGEKFHQFSPPALIGEIFLFFIQDRIEDMATFTALAKIFLQYKGSCLAKVLSSENFHVYNIIGSQINTCMNFIQQKYLLDIRTCNSSLSIQRTCRTVQEIR